MWFDTRSNRLHRRADHVRTETRTCVNPAQRSSDRSLHVSDTCLPERSRRQTKQDQNITLTSSSLCHAQWDQQRHQPSAVDRSQKLVDLFISETPNIHMFAISPVVFRRRHIQHMGALVCLPVINGPSASPSEKLGKALFALFCPATDPRFLVHPSNDGPPIKKVFQIVTFVSICHARKQRST